MKILGNSGGCKRFILLLAFLFSTQCVSSAGQADNLTQATGEEQREQRKAELQRKRSERIAQETARRQRLLEAGALIELRVWTLPPNSAGGVSLCYQFTVLSPEPLKYVFIGARAFNAVGDPESDRIDRSPDMRGRLVGPFQPSDPARLGDRIEGCFEISWYNVDITCAKVTSVEVTTMSDQTVRYDEQQIALATKGSCERPATTPKWRDPRSARLAPPYPAKTIACQKPERGMNRIGTR